MKQCIVSSIHSIVKTNRIRILTKSFTFLIILLTLQSAQAQPPNDDCSNALILTESVNNSCNNIVSGTTLSATESMESGICINNLNDDDVWYSFTPSQTSLYYFELSNTSQSSRLSIFEGTCAGGLTSIGATCAFSTNAADLTMGTTYLIQVYSVSSSSTVFTTFDLCAFAAPIPTNDECTNAIALTESVDTLCNNKISGTTRAATRSTETTLCNCLLYTSPSPRDRTRSRMPSSA